MPAPSKVAIVTGAARGIGLSIARQFLATDWNVVLVDIDEPALMASCEQLTQSDSTNAHQGGQQQSGFDKSRLLALSSDVSDPDQVQQVAQQCVDQFGRIDALVNNAGVASFKPVLETSFAEWTEVMNTNLNGPFLYTQACAPIMLKTGGGSIVNIASISGLRASLLRVAYGTSKAAVIHLTKQQAAELGNVGIRVNAVAPGPVDTAMAKKVHSSDIRADYHHAIPLNRYGSEDEIASTVLFLCSEGASYINGQTIAVDGGFDSTGIGLQSLRDGAP